MSNIYSEHPRSKVKVVFCFRNLSTAAVSGGYEGNSNWLFGPAVGCRLNQIRIYGAWYSINLGNTTLLCLGIRDRRALFVGQNGPVGKTGVQYAIRRSRREGDSMMNHNARGRRPTERGRAQHTYLSRRGFCCRRRSCLLLIERSGRVWRRFASVQISFLPTSDGSFSHPKNPTKNLLFR